MQLFDNDDNTSPTTTTTTTTHPSTDHPPPHHKKQWLKANSKNPKRQPQKRKQFPLSPQPSPPKKTNIFLFSLSPSNPNRKQLGARIIKPSKNSSALKTAQFKKKHSSGMTALTEKSLASRAGHLELLKGGKREKRQELAKKALEGEGGKGKK